MEKGIQNLKEVVLLGAQIFSAIGEAKKNDGKIDLNDAGLLFGLFPAFSAALKDIGEVVPEAKDLSAEELAELIAAVAPALGGLEESVKVKIEKSLLAAKAVYEAIKAFA